MTTLPHPLVILRSAAAALLFALATVTRAETAEPASGANVPPPPNSTDVFADQSVARADRETGFLTSTFKKDCARALYKYALVQFDENHHAAALAAFAGSYALLPMEGLKLDMAKCLDKLGRAADAIEAYEAAIALGLGDKDELDRARLRIAALKLKSEPAKQP